MIPGQFDLEIYQGDTFYLPSVEIPSLASHGGPANLTGSEIKATVYRKKGADVVTVEMDVELLDPNHVRLTMTPEATSQLPVARKGEGRWDLEITAADGWVGTPLAGKATIIEEVPETATP